MRKYKLEDSNEKYYRDIVKRNVELLEGKSEIPREYIDPDLKIVEEKNVNNLHIRFSTDGVCGIKYLMKYYKENNVEKAYEIIRSKIIIWPKHRQSINQRRFSVFRDRFDFSIFDIKMFYKNRNEGKAYSKIVKEQSISAIFLNELGEFKNFVEEYGLSNFLVGEDVINLATGKIIKSYDDYRFSDVENTNYIQGLLDVIAK